MTLGPNSATNTVTLINIAEKDVLGTSNSYFAEVIKVSDYNK